MGVSRTFCYLLQRILVPLVLASAVILRQNILSTIYLILLLLAPLLPVPTPENVIKGVNGVYLKVIIGLSSAANLAHIISQIVFLAAFNYSTSIDYCSTTGQILNLIGLHRLNGVSFFNILRLCCLDFVVLLVSCLVYAFCSRTYHSRLFQSKESITPNTENRLLHLNDRRFTCGALSSYSNAATTTAASAVAETTRLSADFKLQLNRKRQKMYIAQRLSYCVCEAIFFLTLCASAILEPSLTSSVYFLYFLFIGSWFALDKSFGTGYHYFRIFIALFVGVHFFSIFLYQFMLFRPLIPPTDINARLFGLVEYTQTNCTNVRDFVISDYHFVRFFHPIVLLVLYFVSINLIQTVLIQKKLSKLSRTIYQSIDDEPSTMDIGAQRSLSMNSEPNDQDHDHDHSHNLHKSILSTQSVHLNYVYDNRFNDNTPLLRQGRPNRTYSSVGERSTCGPFERPTRDGSSSIIVPAAADSASAFSNIHSNVSLATTSLPPTTPTTPNTRNPMPIKSAWSKDNNNQFSLFFIQLFDMIKRASYVITLIVMMTWSITYHSWLSFVLLLSSCIIWMTPNSRQTCLNSSPILVFYALLLVIGQYIYSLNLTDQELPAHIGTVSISEIGFKKYGEFSYQPLFVKIFYLMFFWITLRQYTESLKPPETAAAQVDPAQTPGILSPLFNLGPAVGRALSRQHTQTEFNLVDGGGVGVVNSSAQSKLFDSMIKCFKEILVKYWIWIVAIMLMVMSLSGSKVVIYRIVYMFLFLIFIWLFLISLKWWRKLIYPFWLVVILYSMIILIAIYTYQFNCFPDYWEQYLYIDKELQEDLGLVVYDNDAFVLFKELLTPTFFIIITIIQVHFVHKDFLELSNIDEIRLQQQQQNNGGGSQEYSISMDISTGNKSNRFSSQASLDPSMDGGGVAEGGAKGVDKSDLKSQPSQSELSVQTVISKKQQQQSQQQPTSNPNAVEHGSGMADNDDDDAAAAKTAELNRSKASLQKPTLAQEMQQVCRMLFRKIRRFIHEWMVVFWRFLEIHIMKFVFLCAVNIIIRDISVMNVVFVFLSIFLMVFNKFETTICFIFAIWSGLLVLLKMLFQLNIAQRIEWHTNCTFDFNQTTIDNRQYIGFLKTDDIFSYIWEYILLIIILVFRVIILLRQSLYRNKEYGDRLLLDFVIFPEVDRSMADKDFACFLKYLFNFGFYKFGVEICLILVTISIGNHGDIFSVLYCLFLTLFVLFNRQECARFWAYFVGFMAVALPYQYLMCLGIPPGLCLEYPWKNIPPSDLEWYYLPDFRHQLPKDKLYLDFLLFFLLCRQLLYFRLEPKLIQYGGSNLEAYREKTPPNVSDFFSFGQSMFDTFKSYFLFCFFWITLAILFLAGTTRINLFGLGYVLGSFIFLWNGNEFYLKQSNVIFKLWKIIIGYTCMAMLLKSILQVFVLTMLRNNLCNVVQLMGISYAKESVDPETQKLLDKCPINEAGLLWDGICFTFLLVQKRIFCSHYFKFLVREIKAQHFLASRGAELIHEIQAQEVAEQEIAEREVMEKIKQKMDRIKEAQQKMFANQARSIKYHKQDEYDYDISPYSGVDETLSQASEADDLFTQTLPTVYSPTPSIPTITSPQSATTLQPGYFEVYSVWPIRPIDASSSSNNTIPSFSLSSNIEPRSHSHSNHPQPQPQPPQLKVADDGSKLLLKDESSLLKVVGGGVGHAHHHPHPLHPHPHYHSVGHHHPQHRSSLSSSAAAMKFPLMMAVSSSSFARRLSHASSVKSGGYYMFEDGEDTEICDLSHKTRGSLIPDPEGDEIKNLAKSKGFTAFCSKIFKGEDPSEAALVSAESTDVGESSKDSAIVSVERLKPHPDSSRQTTMTSIPLTSQQQETDISNMSSLASSSGGGGDAHQDPTGRKSYADIQMAVPPPTAGAGAVATTTSVVANGDAEMQPAEDKTYLEKINSWFDFIKKFAESILISSTSNLNSVSRDYRFVAKRLAVEKKCLKKIIEINELDSGHRHDFISDQNWKKSILSKLSKLTEEDLENVAKSDPKETRRVWDQLDETSCEGNKHLYLVSLDSHYMDRSIYIHFFRAIFYAILSRSEVICYITIVINQITSASILSLPLPLMAFLWGSLSVPRPSKSFWVTCITYIEVVVVLKYVFQFRFWEWNTIVNTSPFWWPRILGIEKKDNYANYDLVLLLVLFFHRFMLKSLGLWDLSETEIKAYMTNAELFQSRQEADDQQQKNMTPNDNNGGGGGGGGHGNGGSSKRLKKKKSKTKSDKAAAATPGQQPPEPGEQKMPPARLQSTEEIIPMTIHSPSIDEIANIDGDPTGDTMMTMATTMVTNNNNNNQNNQLMLDDHDDDDDGHDINVIYLMMETPSRLRKKCLAMVKPAYKFFHNVLHPPYRITHDVYSLMFLCDFINFFILVFGFYAFGSGYSSSEDVARFLEENKIPIGFLITLLIQFAQIIVDRAIYLRKYIKGKLIFQIIIVIFTHMWLFFVLPLMTDKSFTDKTNLPPKLWYVFKCIYFLLSAYQIRSGYPTRILGNTFCKKYNFVNWYLFKVYMLIPFVYDLRMYMDWIWTDTSLVLDEWSLMEDIFVNLYQRKCELKLDEEFPEPRGKPKKRFFKYLIGGAWVIIIIALIWGPLVLFAFGRAVGEVNPPIGATFELEIGGYQPLFKMSVTGSGLQQITEQKWQKLSSAFSTDAVAQTFISGYDRQDVYVVNLNGNSTAVWGISPPSQKILQRELLSNQTILNMKLTYYLIRKKAKNQDMDATIYDEYFIELHPTKDEELRRKLSKMISDQQEHSPVVIPSIFPNYLRAPEKGKPIVVTELIKEKNYPLNKSMNYRNLLILLKKGQYENQSFSTTSWWEIHDDCQNNDYLDPFLKDLMKTERCQYLPVVVFNDKVFIGLLAFLSGYGIIGIYTTFVFLVSRWVRGLNSESSFKVIYTRMPNVDRVLQLCLDIYLVRESREFELEEDLYAKLIFLYRSPETLIKWTKINEEINTGTTGTGTQFRND